MNDKEIRVECLKLSMAMFQARNLPEDVVKRAIEFEKYVFGAIDDSKSTPKKRTRKKADKENPLQ
jgi:hypothetical protein